VKADCIRFHPDSSLVLAAYLNYAVNSPGIRRRTSSTIHGVGRPRLRLADIKAITIPVAPRDEQSRIADALDELFCDLDAGVAALERVGVKLKLYRASVLKAAVEGALTAEWRAQHLRTESASELLERILAERRRRWEEDQLAKFKAKGHEPPKTWKAKYKDPLAPDTTNLPPLPEGWCWATVEQVATLVTDGDHNPPKRVSLGVAHLTAKNIRNLRLSFDDCSFITRDDAFRVFRRYQPKKGDLIVTCVGTVGRTAIVPDDLEFSPDRNLAAVRFSSVGPIVAYVEYFLEAPHVQTALMTMSGSTAQPHLYLGDLRTLPIALPPLAEQEGIVEAVEDQLSVIDHLEADLDAKLKNAQGLRQAILRHAFTGQLVSQDPNDEPASELLKRIAAERESRGASGSRRRRAHS